MQKDIEKEIEQKIYHSLGVDSLVKTGEVTYSAAGIMANVLSKQHKELAEAMNKHMHNMHISKSFARGILGEPWEPEEVLTKEERYERMIANKSW